MVAIRQQLQHLLRAIHRRLNSMISRAIVLQVNSDSALQSLQIQRNASEVFDNVEHIEPYGFTSRVHADAEAIVLARGGMLSHALTLATPDRRYRLKGLQPGEVALYDDLGNKIVFHRDRIEVFAKQHIDITAPACHIQAVTTHDGNVTINGNLTVKGNVTATGNVTASGPISSPTGVSSGAIELGSHIHGDGTNSNGDTGAPK